MKPKLLVASISSLYVALVFLRKAKAYPETQRSRLLPLTDLKGNLQYMPAVMNYVAPTVQIAHLRRDVSGSDDAVDAEWSAEEVLVRNARYFNQDGKLMSLHRNGFELVQRPLIRSMQTPQIQPIDFFDSRDVLDRYYPQCESLLQEILGPHVKVKAFDHNIRVAETKHHQEPLKNGRGATVQNPLAVVHGDYTSVSAPRRLRDLTKPPKVNDVYYNRLPEGSSALLDGKSRTVMEAINSQRRFALINVWRSIDPEHPVQTMPLACVDAQTVSRSDLRTLQINYTDRIGENILPTRGEAHEWMFYPDMTIDEALLIKQWDSAGAIAQGKDRDEENLSSFCLHSAFLEPYETNTPPPRPRKSIEVRCVCVWDDKKES